MGAPPQRTPQPGRRGPLPGLGACLRWAPLAALALLLILPRLSPPAAGPPVQARVELRLAERLLRISLHLGEDLPLDLGPRLARQAEHMLAEAGRAEAGRAEAGRAEAGRAAPGQGDARSLGAGRPRAGRGSEEAALARRDLGLLLALGALLGACGLAGVASWLQAARRPPPPAPRPPEAARSPWRATALTLGFQLLALTLALAMGPPLLRAGLSEPLRAVLVQAALYALGISAALLGAGWVARGARAPATALVGLGPLTPRLLGLGLLGFCRALPLVLLATWLGSLVLGAPPRSANPALAWLVESPLPERLLLALMVTVGAPLAEEVIFRGILYAGWRDRIGPLAAALGSALYFALVHGDPQALLPLTSLGLLFAWLYEETGSLWPPILAHGLWNGATTLILTLAMTGG